MGILHQAIKDAVGDGGITDLLVPARERSCNLGWQNEKVTSRPVIEMFLEKNIRAGFVTDAEDPALAAACRKLGELWMETIYVLGSRFGWLKEKLSTLKVEQFEDRSPTLGIIRLKPSNARNARVYEAPITG
jgi:hypothetical protein